MWIFENGVIKDSSEHTCEHEVEQKKTAAGKRYAFTKKGIAIFTSLCILIAGFAGFGGAAMAMNISENQAHAAAAASQMSTLDLAKATGSKLTINEIITMNADAVVEIRTESVSTDAWMQQYVTQGAGSGVIIDSSGYIATNNHVIDNAGKITVSLKNGKEYTAKLVGTDSDTDLAVLKIDANNLTAAVYGDSDVLQVGDLAVAIGNPLGKLGGTSTAGIISALDRELQLEGRTMTLLQTDASINPGNSGGGLFNGNGELVGIVVAKSTGSGVEGLGFAIPINAAKTVLEQIVDNGYVKGRPATGMTFVDLTSVRNALMYGVSSTGIYVKSVDSDNAKNAGFQAGDLIYAVENKRIQSAEDLSEAFSAYKVGDKVTVKIIRNNSTQTLTLTMSERTS